MADVKMGNNPLDKSLDEIARERKANNRKKLATRRNRKASNTGKTGTAPVGGVQKPTKQAKPTNKGVPTGPSAAPKTSKIVVSGLPTDVNQVQIKEYFQKSVGAVRRVEIRYNQNGVSRGVADITFAKPDAAAKAAKDLNGMLVDKKPMKIEVVMDASNVPEPAPAKSLSERVAYAKSRRSNMSTPLTNSSANPKAQPKSATATKSTANNANRGGRVAGRAGKPKRGRNANRPKPKTAEELDAEMTDYFAVNTNANGTTAAGAATTTATNGDDLGMDEISVSSIEFII